MKIKTMAMAALVCTMGTAAFAQIGPTTSSGRDAVSIGSNSATVSQNVTLNLPLATALHLDVTDLIFDLTTLGAPNSTMACVYAKNNTDVVIPTTDGNFYGQATTLPLGTRYDVNAWPNITPDGAGAVSSYPPININKQTGELVEGSKNYFVCYKTFVLQTFSNGRSFELTLRRSDDLTRSNAIRSIYAQANACDTWGANTGLYKITDKATQMIPKNLSKGTTGSHTGGEAGEVGNREIRSRCGYKSWLDYLVVVALPVDGEAYGKNTATLEYSLVTTLFDTDR